MNTLKIVVFIIVGILLVGCCYQPPISEIKCVDVFYVEVNAGTMTRIISESDYGITQYQVWGRYECADTKLIYLDAGNINARSGLRWKKIN